MLARDALILFDVRSTHSFDCQQLGALLAEWACLGKGLGNIGVLYRGICCPLGCFQLAN